MLCLNDLFHFTATNLVLPLIVSRVMEYVFGESKVHVVTAL